MTIVYSASSGEYSDYEVARLFKTREKAVNWVLDMVRAEKIHCPICNSSLPEEDVLWSNIYVADDGLVYGTCPVCNSEERIDGYAAKGWFVESFEVED